VTVGFENLSGGEANSDAPCMISRMSFRCSRPRTLRVVIAWLTLLGSFYAESIPQLKPSGYVNESKAFRVFSGMVFTLKGTARALTYRMSDAVGSLTPVLAQSRRWGRAPKL
jgi:hypothetical protein